MDNVEDAPPPSVEVGDRQRPGAEDPALTFGRLVGQGQVRWDPFA